MSAARVQSSLGPFKVFFFSTSINYGHCSWRLGNWQTRWGVAECHKETLSEFSGGIVHEQDVNTHLNHPSTESDLLNECSVVWSSWNWEMEMQLTLCIYRTKTGTIQPISLIRFIWGYLLLLSACSMMYIWVESWQVHGQICIISIPLAVMSDVATVAVRLTSRGGPVIITQTVALPSSSATVYSAGSKPISRRAV